MRSYLRVDKRRGNKIEAIIIDDSHMMNEFFKLNNQCSEIMDKMIKGYYRHTFIEIKGGKLNVRRIRET